jgi:hypothetical protein
VAESLLRRRFGLLGLLGLLGALTSATAQYLSFTCNGRPARILTALFARRPFLAIWICA